MEQLCLRGIATFGVVFGFEVNFCNTLWLVGLGVNSELLRGLVKYNQLAA
jgi:hypothetical protein